MAKDNGCESCDSHVISIDATVYFTAVLNIRIPINIDVNFKLWVSSVLSIVCYCIFIPVASGYDSSTE